MKRMKCNQLGGPTECEHEFTAASFEEIGEQSKKHAMENMDTHKEAMNKMSEMSQEEMQKWFEEKKQEFESL